MGVPSEEVKARLAAHLPDCGLCREYEMFLNHYECLHPGSTLIPRIDPDGFLEDKFDLDAFLKDILKNGAPKVLKGSVAFVRTSSAQPVPIPDESPMETGFSGGTPGLAPQGDDQGDDERCLRGASSSEAGPPADP